MSANINADLKIPDLWYDFYARFLPGVLFVAALYILWPGSLSMPSGWSVSILAFAGYIAGLTVQPISSEITGLFHGNIAQRVTGDKDYVYRQNHLDPIRILSKMHGETTFFIQCTILGILFLILQNIPAIQLKRNHVTVVINVIVIIFASLMAADTAWRRVKRAKRLAEFAEN